MKPTARLNKILPLLLIAAVTAALAPRVAKFDYEYKVGSTWTYETLFASFDFPILKTQEQILAEMDKAADAAVPYFKYSAGITAASISSASDMDLGTLKPIVVSALKGMPLTVKGTRPFSEAVITRGGVSVKEVKPSTLESKLISGLFLAGEILDVDAFTGGFNLQIAWSTGALAGGSI